MCGILGIANRNDHVFAEIYDGLLMLQHRGQDASGIVTYTGENFRERKANGLVKDVFSAADTETLLGRIGMGHVRYPTAGSLSAAEAQPFFVNAPYGIYLIHNGNLTNTDEQREKVIGLFEPVRAAVGQVIISEGHKSGGFYLVLLGEVRIDKRNEQGLPVTVATLGEGAYFGEVSLLRGDVAQATATASGTVELARLEAKRFYSLVASIPMLWAQVWQEANRRELESLQIVAGTTGNV